MSGPSPKSVASKSISSHKRLEQMLQETEAELDRLQPQIERLEKQIERLRELKFTKRKLIALRLSLQSILENFGAQQAEAFLSGLAPLEGTSEPVMALRTSSGGSSGPRHDFDALEAEGASFLPDRALSEAARVLRRPASLNFEIFRALVFSGGRASSGQIKESLMARGVTLPSSGETLEGLSLSDISSRANYLVRKGLAYADGRGGFRCAVGWTPAQAPEQDPEAAHPSVDASETEAVALAE
ncbi:MAG: hypothetical protein IPK79_05120 [Vampirovibrionales bacterium]|nr:hypothetical protein [Vampirovibrionales bacterium]